ncbi:MAG: malate dehydrogenase [Armatimonadetes bacterium]|nr:malate dehydrogenase [Armatimonadota bacterium]
MRHKITVVGAGNVGATCAQRLAERNYADVVLVDIVPNMPQGKALDIMQAGPIYGYDTLVIGTNGYEETAGSDVVVITSGLPRKPGMSRDDLLFANMDIVKSVVQNISKTSPNAVLIVVTNPLDAMSQLAWQVSGFPAERVMGMAGVLDTARFRTFLAMELKVSVSDVSAHVLGGHGDTMVPVPELTTIGGVPVSHLLTDERFEEIAQRTRDGGAEIVKLLNTSAWYAPSAAVVEMVDAILLDKKKVLPVCALLRGQYGIKDLYVGVPAKLGHKGVEEIVEVRLTEKQRAELQKSVDAVKENWDKMTAKL